MRRLRRLVLTGVMLAWSAQAFAGGCDNASNELTAGQEAGGYFVHLDWPPAAVRGGVDITPAGDYLATQGSATILYQTRFTDPIRESKTWRGADPLTTLRAFAASGNLTVETSTPGLWIVRRSVRRDYLTVIICARPIDPEHQGLQPASQVGDIERALLNELPVRDISGYGDRVGIELSYYWLPEEGPDIFLVQYQGADLGGHAWGSSAYKVRVGRPGGRVTVDCLWTSGDVGGALVPGIAEDFDGDGYRDFVFNSAAGPLVFLEASIISGRDGKTLLRFTGSELAVEQRGSGPKRIAAKLVRPDWDEKTPLRSLSLDEGTGEYVMDRPVGAEGSSADVVAASQSAPRMGLADLLARRVGDRHHVKLFQLKWTPPFYAVDETAISKGYPAHLLYHYESPGFAAEGRRAEKELLLHPPSPVRVTVTTRRDKPPIPKDWRTPSPTSVPGPGTPNRQ